MKCLCTWIGFGTIWPLGAAYWIYLVKITGVIFPHKLSKDKKRTTNVSVERLCYTNIYFSLHTHVNKLHIQKQSRCVYLYRDSAKIVMCEVETFTFTAIWSRTIYIVWNSNLNVTEQRSVVSSLYKYGTIFHRAREKKSIKWKNFHVYTRLICFLEKSRSIACFCNNFGLVVKVFKCSTAFNMYSAN